MPLDRFEIVLDNLHRSYFAGQTVSGKIVVRLTQKPKVIHGIKLRLQGKAKTHWKEMAGRTPRHFSEQETFVDEKVYLLGYESDTSETTLAEGDHTYDFSFPLPSTLPSSFCHKYGQIKYHLEATISRIRKTNHTSNMAFTINGLLDLNNEPKAKLEGVMRNEKTVCCFCCASGPLGLDFRVGKQGFVTGERIGFHAHMYNNSNRIVNCTAVSLIQEIEFLANMGRTKTKTVQICQMVGPKVLSGGEVDWIATPSDSKLRIPSLPPSRLDGCKIINISYYLKLKMEPKDASILKGSLPIIIGTIPLRDYPDLPPSYEEAMNGMRAEDVEGFASEIDSDPPAYGSIDWKSFIPKYVLYEFNDN